MDHLAGSRADSSADAPLALRDDNLASGARQSSGGRKAKDAGADNETIDRVNWRPFPAL
jgi:hypothetical protein